MAETTIYRAGIVGSKGRSVVITQKGSALTIRLEGFGKPILLQANRGGTGTCRTIVEHVSAETRVTISLAMPDPRARCRMLPSFVSVESSNLGLSLDEANLKRVSGSNARVRSTVKKILGTLDEEEG